MVYDFNVGTFNAGVWSINFDWATIAGEGNYQVQVVAKDFTSGETQSLGASYQLTSLANGGHIAVNPTANPLVALFSAPPCPIGSNMEAIFRPAGSTVWSGTDWKMCTGNTSMNFYVAGLYPSSSYVLDYQVLTGGSMVAGPATVNFTTGPLPSNITFPKFAVGVPGPKEKIDAQQPMILQSPGYAGNGSNFPVATDLSGRIIWYYHAEDVALLTRPLPDETMLEIQTGASWSPYTNVQQLLRQFDLAGNVVHQTNAGVLQQELLALGAVNAGSCDVIPNPAPVGAACMSFFNHELTQLPNGYVAALATIEKIFPPGTQGSTSPLPVDIQGDIIVVLDNNWQAVWYWDAFNEGGGGYGYPKLPVSRTALLGETCVSLSNLCGPLYLAGKGTAAAGNQWLHGNSLYYSASSGDLLFSMRSQDWVVKIDYNNGAGSGDVLWRLGNGGDFTFNNINNDPWPWFSAQHDATYANYGAGPLTIFDDGNTRRADPPLGLGSACSPYCSSRGMALNVDETNMVVTPVLSQYLNQNARAYGSAQLLSNGNYFFNAGIVNGTYGFDLEVLPTSGAVNGTNIYTDQSQPLYRSYRMATLYQPLMDLPANLTKSAGDGQGTPVSQTFATPLQVTVTDPNGVPLFGIPVTFAVIPGAGGAGATFNATPSMPILTNVNGIATAPALTANGVGGTFSVLASVNTLNATFTLTNQVYGYLSAYTATVGSAAGSGSVLLTAGGAWNASSNASWLQLSPGSTGGSGNALIQFSYSANQSTAARTATLTIAGLTFTVTQAGTSYSPITLVTPLLSSGLNNPQGLAADAAGDVFIADTANNAIKQWNPGTQQTALLSSAQNSPAAVAVDGFGNVYIADSGNHAIEEFTAPGQQLNTLVSGLSNPSGVAVDGQGNVYFSDTSNNAIEEWNAASQQVTTLVGSGLNNPTGVAVDTQGNVYFADSGNNSIKQWASSNGLVTPLVSSGLNNPTSVAVDGQGNVYFADTGNNAIKQWNAASQQVTALVSTGLSNPMGVAVDGQGNIYVADSNHNAIERLTPIYLALSATSLTEPATAGTDSITAQVLPASIPLTATSDQPWLTVSGINSGVIGLSFPANTTGANLTAHVSVLGQPVTVTQSGDAPANLTKLAGDGQTTAPGQAFATPLQVTVTDSGGIPLPGVAVTFTVTAGTSGASGIFSSNPPMPILTDINGNATAPALTATSSGGSFSVTASVNGLSVMFTETTVIDSLGASALAVGSAAGSGSVLLSASEPWTASSNAAWLQLSAGSTSGTGNALIQFTYAANPNSAAQTGTLTIDGLTFTVTQAGTSYSPISQLTTLVSTGLNNPQAVAVDAAGNVYVADTFGNAIRKWNAGTQQVVTLVSSGLNNPTGVAVGVDGNVYIADEKNKAMKEWRGATGTVTPLVSGGLNSPVGVAVDSQNNVYFSDAGHNAIDEWNAASGKVTVLVAGAGLNLPLGTAVDAVGNVYFADEKNNSIKEWSVAGQILTLVSTGLNTPYGVAVDGDGNVYFADTGNNAVKEWIAATGQVTTLVSTGLKSPCGVAVDAQGNVYIADSGDNAIKKFTPAYLALGANSRTEAAAAGTDSISFQVLPASTVVTATSNQTWLTISSVNSGAISFAWAANTTASSRSALITVLGQTVTITQNADVPTTLNKTAGLAQSTPVGQAFAIPMQVKVLDAAGKPVQGASVTFKVVAAPNGAGGTFAASPAMPILTNSSGIANAPVLTANSTPGTFGVTVTVGSLSTVFGATVTSN